MINKLLKVKLVQRLLWIMLLAAIWEITALSGVFPIMLFPPIENIFHSLWNSAINGEIILQTFYSLFVIVKGIFIGTVLALLIAFLSRASEIFESFLDTATAIAHPLPGIALLPLVILWCGTGETSVVVLIVHSVLWPVVLNMTAGFRVVPAMYNELGQSFGFSKFKISLKIMLPASLPYFLTGVKIGWARAWRALISAEMIFGAIGGSGGLGWYIFKQRVFMDTPGIYAGLLVIVIIGVLVEELVFEAVEKRTINRWGMSVNGSSK